MHVVRAVLAFAAGCAAPVRTVVPREPPAVSEPLAAPVVFSVSEPAARYGGPTEAAASPVAEAFLQVARSVAGAAAEISRDGRLDQLCAELAPVIAQGITPSASLIELGLHAHGVVESSGRVLVARRADTPDQIVTELRAQLGDTLAGRFRLGLARGGDGPAVAILVRSSGVVLEVPRAVPAGSSFVIEGRLLQHLRMPRIKILHEDGSLEHPAAASLPEGRFTSSFACGARTGRQWIEVSAEALQGVITLAGVPVECGSSAVSSYRAEPPRNLEGLAAQATIERRLTSLINRERAAAHLPALRTDPLVAAVARRHAEHVHAASPDRRDARARLRAAGIVPPRIFELTLVVPDAAHAAEALSNDRAYRALLDRPDLTHTGVGVALGATAEGRPRLTVTVTCVEFLPFIDPQRVRDRVLAVVRERRVLRNDAVLMQLAQRFASYLAAGRRRAEVWPEIKQEIDLHASELERYVKVSHRTFQLFDTTRLDRAELLQGARGSAVGVGVAQSPRHGAQSGVTWVVLLAGEKGFTTARGQLTQPD